MSKTNIRIRMPKLRQDSHGTNSNAIQPA